MQSNYILLLLLLLYSFNAIVTI